MGVIQLDESSIAADGDRDCQLTRFRSFSSTA